MTAEDPDSSGTPSLSSRVSHRLSRNARRALDGFLRSGPGRIAGAVLSTHDGPDDVTIGGWVAPASSRVVAVVVTVNGTPLTLATLDLPTPVLPDVGPVVSRSSTAGWEALVDRDLIPDGEVTVGALVVRADNLVDDVVSLRAMVRVPRLGAIDSPSPGVVVTEPLMMVRGWVLSEEVDRVEVRLGSGAPHRARLMAEVRPDIAQRFDEPSAPLAGWSVTLDVTAERDEATTALHVEAVGAGRRTLLAAQEVDIRAGDRVAPPDQPRLRRLSARADAEARRHVAGTDGVSLLVGTHDLGLGGGQLYLQELLRHVVQADDVTCTVLSHADGPLRDELEEWGARVLIVGPVPGSGTAYESRMVDLAYLASTTSANIVLANTAGAFWAVDLAARLELPCLWAVHESFSVDQFVLAGLGGVDDHVRARLDEAFAYAAAVVFEADATAEVLAAAVPPGRSVRIDYGVDLERIAAFRSTHDRGVLRRSLGYGDDDIVLLCLGTYEPRKAQAELCAAFARVAARYPHARLALVGDTRTDYSSGLHELVDRLELAGRIALIPVTPDIDTWYFVADCFVLASDVESLPRSMLEVMAFDVPVLGAAVFGVPELITDGVEGMLFEPRSMASLTAALDRLLALDPDERRKLGRRAGDASRAATGATTPPSTGS